MSGGDELGLGATVAATADALGATADTIGATADATADTLAAASDGSVEAADDGRTIGGGGQRTTVLPGVTVKDGRPQLVHRDEPRYPTERVLGEGGMGVVELARDEDIGRRVAIKRLRPEHREPAALARFVDEVRTVGKLEHPGIAPIHDVGVDENGAFFFVMKYVEGETLEDIIDRLREGDPKTRAEFPFERRTAIFMSMLNALEYAHSAGLIHRDLKPANVMIGPYGEVLLMDWGIARPIGGEPDVVDEEDATGDDEGDGRGRLVSTRAGSVIGTPLYMSPEQARGETDTLDARSDVYSAAVVFLELLTLGHPLDEHRNVAAICAALQAAEAPWVGDPFWDRHDQGRPVPSELRHFLVRALKNDRAERWQSVGEMLAELERIRAGEFRVQCPATFMKRIQHRSLSFIDRHPILANAGALLALLTFVGSVGGFLYLLLAA